MQPTPVPVYIERIIHAAPPAPAQIERILQTERLIQPAPDAPAQSSIPRQRLRRVILARAIMILLILMIVGFSLILILGALKVAGVMHW
jgi:hypothetical protein